MACTTSHNGIPFKVDKKMNLTSGKYKIRNKSIDRAKQILAAIKER